MLRWKRLGRRTGAAVVSKVVEWACEELERRTFLSVSAPGVPAWIEKVTGCSALHGIGKFLNSKGTSVSRVSRGISQTSLCGSPTFPSSPPQLLRLKFQL